MSLDFIREDDIDRDRMLCAERDSGRLVAWRKDCEGRWWFQRIRAIHAVPKTLHALPAYPIASATLPVIDADDVDDDEDTIEAPRALKRYAMIVQARAQGTDIPPDLGWEILEAAGKTFEQFNDDVELCARLDAEIEDDA